MTIRRSLANFLAPVLLVAGLPLVLCASRAAADAAPRGEELQRTLGMEFVLIPGGEFEMGSERRRASTTRSRCTGCGSPEFRIGKTEVTQAQWAAVMGNNPSTFTGCDDCPVEKVSWDDVQEFIRKARALTGLSLRLPTEAEWEYAAGGGAAAPEVGGDEQRERDWPTTPGTERTRSARPTRSARSTEPVRAVRHERERLGVVLGLVHRHVLRRNPG